jgi:hypothetical protein
MVGRIRLQLLGGEGIFVAAFDEHLVQPLMIEEVNTAIGIFRENAGKVHVHGFVFL